MRIEDRQTRRMKGFEPAGGLLKKDIRKIAEERGFAVARLLTHWPEVAGTELATVTRPLKVSYGQGGFGATLTVLVKGASAPLVELQLPALRDRVNACYGYNAVSRIRLTQTGPDDFAATEAAPPPEPPHHPEIAALTSGIGDAKLREALEGLGNRVLSRQQNKGS